MGSAKYQGIETKQITW